MQKVRRIVFLLSIRVSCLQVLIVGASRGRGRPFSVRVPASFNREMANPRMNHVGLEVVVNYDEYNSIVFVFSIVNKNNGHISKDRVQH